MASLHCCAGDQPVISAQRLRSWTDEVLELHEAGALDQALARADDLVAAAARADLADPVVRESLFAAQFERALLLSDLGDLGEAATAYAVAAEVPIDESDPDQRHEVAMALLNRGICLEAVDDDEGALNGYQTVVARFGDADDPVTRDQVVRARVNAAVVLLRLGRAGEALASTTELVAELGGDDALEAEQLAMAVRLRAMAHGELGRPEDAVAALEATSRCRSDAPPVLHQVAEAARERAELLDSLGRGDQALRVVEDAIVRIGGGAPELVDVREDLIGLRERWTAGSDPEAE